MTDVPAWLPVVTAVGAVGATLVGGWQKARIDRKHRIESESKEQRFDLYKRLNDVLRNSDDVTGPNKAALMVDIGLFASDDVARAWTAYIDALFAGTVKGKNCPENVRHLGAILLAMRKDSSRPDTKLTGVDLVACLGLRQGRSAEDSEAKTPPNA